MARLGSKQSFSQSHLDSERKHRITMEDLSEYNGKRVVLVRNLSEPNEKGETAVEVEGTVQAANEQGVLIKPKGKASFDLVPADEIEEIRLAEAGEKKLRQKVLKPVQLGQARSHLLERHGLTLDEANEMSEEQAFEEHAEIDHSPLGHRHEAKDEQDQEAVAQAESA